MIIPFPTPLARRSTVPESPLDPTLQRLLAYPEASNRADGDRFVVAVKNRVRRERRRRRLVLSAFGGVGALFGLLGAAWLADPIARLFSDGIPADWLMQGALLVAGAAAFHAWMMGDDLPLRD